MLAMPWVENWQQPVAYLKRLTARFRLATLPSAAAAAPAAAAAAAAAD